MRTYNVPRRRRSAIIANLGASLTCFTSRKMHPVQSSGIGVVGSCFRS